MNWGTHLVVVNKRDTSNLTIEEYNNAKELYFFEKEYVIDRIVEVLVPIIGEYFHKYSFENGLGKIIRLYDEDISALLHELLYNGSSELKSLNEDLKFSNALYEALNEKEYFTAIYLVEK